MTSTTPLSPDRAGGPPDPEGRRALVERHHSTTGGSRIMERTGVAGLPVRGGDRRAPPGAAGVVPAGLVTRLTYVLWPSKRRWANANFGHVLGLPPDDPAVRKLALRGVSQLRAIPRRAHAAAAHAPRDRRDPGRIEGPRDPAGDLARVGQPHPRCGPRRQQRVHRSRCRLARPADPRPGRRHELSRDVRAPERTAPALRRDGDPVAQHPRDLRDAEATASCWRSSSIGAIGPTASPSGSSAPGPRSRPGRPSSPRGPARASCRSSPIDGRTGRSS